MKKRWSVMETSADGNHKSVGLPHTRLVAMHLARRTRQRSGVPLCLSITVVNHDEEMRRWGRPDFVTYPTVEDERAAEAMRATVIPCIAPGESVTTDLGTAE